MNACAWAGWKVVLKFHNPALLPSHAASLALTRSSLTSVNSDQKLLFSPFLLALMLARACRPRQGSVLMSYHAEVP